MFPSRIERSPFLLTPSRIGFIYLCQSTRAARQWAPLPSPPKPPWRNLHPVRPIRGPGGRADGRCSNRIGNAGSTGVGMRRALPGAGGLLLRLGQAIRTIDLVMLSIMLLTLGRDWSLQVLTYRTFNTYRTLPDERPADVAPIIGCPPPHYAPPPPCVRG